MVWSASAYTEERDTADELDCRSSPNIPGTSEMGGIESGNGPGSGDREESQTTVRRLTAALEDIVALAHSGGEARQRIAAMERRAMTALSGADALPLKGQVRPDRRQEATGREESARGA